MARLTYKARKNLSSSTFALPGRKYPIPDRSHGENALARVSEFGTPSQKAEVRSKVHKKFPGIGKSKSEASKMYASRLKGGY